MDDGRVAGTAPAGQPPVPNIPANVVSWVRGLLHRWAAKTAPPGPSPSLDAGSAPPLPPPALNDATLRTLIGALDAHGILGLVHAAGNGGHAVPEPVSRVARRAAMAHAARGHVLLGALEDALEALEGAGIPTLVVKGAALCQRRYDGPTQRPFSDLDLMIRDRDLGVASDALEAVGYRRAIQEAPGLAHHVTLERRGAADVPVVLELHRRPLASPPFDRVLSVDDLFERAVPVDIGTTPARTTSPVDTVLHLSGHLVLQHARFERLIWVVDLDRELRAGIGDDPREWDELAERAGREGLTDAVDAAVRLAQYWTGTPVPTGWKPASSTRQWRAAHRRVRARPPLGREGARLWSDVLGIPGFRRKAAFAWRHVFPSPDYIRAWYRVDQDWRLPIYYARRIGRGIAHILARFWRRGAAEIRRRARSTRDGPHVAGTVPPERWMIEEDDTP